MESLQPGVQRGPAWSTTTSGCQNGGEQVCNIAAYDASGQPLVGVQLFDQSGRPLDVQCYGQAGRTVPWVLGDVTRWNVFPLGVRASPARRPVERADVSDAAFPTPDRATTPEVTNPLLPEPVEVEGESAEGEGAGREVGRPEGRRRQQAVTATGTPLSAALPDTSSRSGSVRSLIETPGTSRLRVMRTPSFAWP